MKRDWKIKKTKNINDGNVKRKQTLIKKTVKMKKQVVF